MIGIFVDLSLIVDQNPMYLKEVKEDELWVCRLKMDKVNATSFSLSLNTQSLFIFLIAIRKRIIVVTPNYLLSIVDLDAPFGLSRQAHLRY